MMHSNLFIRGDSVYQNEKKQPFSRIEEIETYEDNDKPEKEEKEEGSHVKGLERKLKMLRAIVERSKAQGSEK